MLFLDFFLNVKHNTIWVPMMLLLMTLVPNEKENEYI